MFISTLLSPEYCWYVRYIFGIGSIHTFSRWYEVVRVRDSHYCIVEVCCSGICHVFVGNYYFSNWITLIQSKYTNPTFTCKEFWKMKTLLKYRDKRTNTLLSHLFKYRHSQLNCKKLTMIRARRPHSNKKKIKKLLYHTAQQRT